MVIDHRKNTIVALHKCRAALDPVTAVVISHLAKFADGCAMDMAAEHGVHSITFRIMRHSGFELADKAHRVFHTPLGVRAERPVPQAETAPGKIDERIERKQKLVTKGRQRTRAISRSAPRRRVRGHE